jgi:hypothetical protein
MGRRVGETGSGATKFHEPGEVVPKQMKRDSAKLICPIGNISDGSRRHQRAYGQSPCSLSPRKSCGSFPWKLRPTTINFRATLSKACGSLLGYLTLTTTPTVSGK